MMTCLAMKLAAAKLDVLDEKSAAFCTCQDAGPTRAADRTGHYRIGLADRLVRSRFGSSGAFSASQQLKQSHPYSALGRPSGAWQFLHMKREVEGLVCGVPWMTGSFGP
jgi:hypothetical protein